MEKTVPDGFRDLFGNPDHYIMDWGVRWKYDRGYWIDELLQDHGQFKAGQFVVCLAGFPTKIIDDVHSLQAAQTVMLVDFEMRKDRAE